MTKYTCGQCRFFLPTGETHYNKPCGYCGNSRVNKPRVSDDEACKLFELDTKAPKTQLP